MTPNQRKVIRWALGVLSYSKHGPGPLPDTGLSSMALAAAFLGVKGLDPDHPTDPSDLGRCLRLIALVPAVRGCVDTLAGRSRQWAALAAIWDDLADLMEAEVGIDWRKGGRAYKTYDAMQKALGRHSDTELTITI